MTLSIVVIEYNSLDDIVRFDRHAKELLNDVDYELIVSSNSCYDISKQMEIKERMPHVHWSFNEQNGGFAYGMNRGLELAQGDYLMIANPDMTLKYGLKEAIAFLHEHKDVGAVGPLIRDQEGEVQDSARTYSTVGRWINRNAKRLLGKEVKCDYSMVQTVDWVIGACILMKREAYQSTGGLDEHYFLYVEDMDLCTRIRAAGLEVVHFIKMEVEYKGTRSARHSRKYAHIFMQSIWYYWKKYGFFSISPKRKKIIFE